MEILKKFSDYKAKKNLLNKIKKEKEELGKLLKEKECIREIIGDILRFTEDREIDVEEFHQLREKAYKFLIDLDLDK